MHAEPAFASGKSGCAPQEFLIYVLAAFLLTWSAVLRTMDFQDLVMFLQARATAPTDTFLASPYVHPPAQLTIAPM